MWRFGSRDDYLQCLTDRPTILRQEPGPAGSHLDGRVHRLFWKEVDNEGALVRLESIEAFYTTTPPYSMCGIRASYGSGVERAVGVCDGEVFRLCLAEDEHIVRALVIGHSLRFKVSFQPADLDLPTYPTPIYSTLRPGG